MAEVTISTDFAKGWESAIRMMLTKECIKPSRIHDARKWIDLYKVFEKPTPDKGDKE